MFCVDKVGTDCSVDQMKSFITGLSVEVVTCFETKPRRRRNEEADATDRKAFRVCIRDDDRGHLLNAAAWPDSIIISEWFFKSKLENNEDA